MSIVIQSSSGMVAVNLAHKASSQKPENIPGMKTVDSLVIEWLGYKADGNVEMLWTIARNTAKLGQF
jgi:hypothetical protein